LKLYDKNAVAKFLDMTPKNVQRLTEKGILQTKQGGLYSLAEATHAYIKYLRDRNPENEENIDLNEERAKLTKAKRLNEELDLSVKKGELHKAEDIEKIMSATLINFKSRLSLPCPGLPHTLPLSSASSVRTASLPMRYGVAPTRRT